MSTALVLSGGGARASYQVGVLRAVSEILEHPDQLPFPVVCGTSAGAINASMLACEADRFSAAVDELDELWSGLTSSSVHEMGLGAVLSSVFSLIRSLAHDGYVREKPWALLDSAPLRELLSKAIRFDRLPERFTDEDLLSLSITALGYTSGASLSFFEGSDLVHGWRRHRRIGVRTRLNLDHLMASTAIPGIYPSVRIHREYFGDGAVRQTAPLSPALHLGAKRLFVVGVSHNPNELEDRRDFTVHPPSIAQMSMHLINSSFIDALEEDMEDLLRLNKIVDKLSPRERASLNLANIDVMSITPSKAFDQVAAKHVGVLPWSMRFLFDKLGATREGGGTSLASYLLFESDFIQELIACGYDDAMAKRDEIATFLRDD